MKKLYWIFAIVVFLSLFGVADFCLAQQGGVSDDQSIISKSSEEIHFFYSAICPHCKKEKEFFKDELKVKYPQIVVKEYEVFYNSENKKILNEFYEKYQVPEKDRGWVPVTFTEKKYFIGFNPQVAIELEHCVEECLGGNVVAIQKIKIPVIGEINISKISLPVLTILLGTLDGFNPCAMWVLVILVSLLLASKSRKKIALVGGIFIFAEGFLYFLIMAAWLNVFLALSYVSLLRILIGLFGIAFGIWRIYDSIFWKPGVCKITEHSKSRQQKILNKINRVLKPSTIPATIFGVIALAFGVNLIEFFCSAGFPTMFTRILALQNLSQFQYYLYLIFYDIFYMLDDFAVFGVAFFTLSSFGFSEKYNRYSTLAAGVLILILGALLILKPELLMFAQ